MTEWEDVADHTDRLEVPGGWLYRTRTYVYDQDGLIRGSWAVALCFVPRPGLVEFGMPLSEPVTYGGGR